MKILFVSKTIRELYANQGNVYVEDHRQQVHNEGMPQTLKNQDKRPTSALANVLPHTHSLGWRNLSSIVVCIM